MTRSEDRQGDWKRHPAEQTGVAPFWLSAEGSLESLVDRFAERLPGGTLYLAKDYSIDGRWLPRPVGAPSNKMQRGQRVSPAFAEAPPPTPAAGAAPRPIAPGSCAAKPK